MYQWPEEDSTPPVGMFFLGFSAPVDGRKYVMYHGTTRENAAAIQASGFHRSPDGMLGPGVYLSRNLRKASYYPVDHPEHDKVVIKVLVNVGRVITINYEGHPRQKNWHDPRCNPVYNTAWIPPRSGLLRGDLEVYCVWDPSRITVIDTIKPRPVQPNGPGPRGYGYGARGYK
eukprot:superscaffoldBa00012988_g25854